MTSFTFGGLILNVLLATYWTLPHSGGLSSYVFYLKDNLEKLGHSVDVFSHHPSYKTYYTWDGTVSVPKKTIRKLIRSELHRIFNQDIEDMHDWIQEMEIERYSFELACSSLDLNHYDVIHVQDVVSAIAFSRVKPRNVGLIATIHGRFTKEFYLSRIIEGEGSRSWCYSHHQEQLGIESCDTVIFPSKWIENTLLQSVGTCNTIVVPYGMNVDWFLSAMSNESVELTVPEKTHIISCVARLIDYKGHKDLILSLQTLLTERSDWICWLVGDGPIRTELQLMVHDLGLSEHVLFLGSRNDVPELLQRTDIFVLPTHIENLPYSVMEAQLAGKPVIVTNVGGIPEMVVHQQSGLIYPVGDFNKLYRYIKLLLEDETLRKKLGNHAKQFALTKWPIGHMTKSILEVYKHVNTSTCEVRKPMEDRQRVPDTGPTIDKKLLIENPLVVNNDILKKIVLSLPDDYVIPDPLLLDKVKH